MTPRRPSRARQAWDLSKWPMVLAAVIAAAQQVVAMRGELQKQDQQAASTASSVAAMQSDLNRTMGKVFGSERGTLPNVEKRVARLEERPASRTLPVQPVRGPLHADSSVRPPGSGFWRAASAPPKAVWHMLKAMFGGKDAQPRDHP